MPETVTVFGADREEGNSVAVFLLQDGMWKVRACVADLSSPHAKVLESAGADIITVNYDDESSIDIALKDSDKCFVLTNTDFLAPDPLQTEIKQGYRIADSCMKHKIKHVVISGHPHVHRRYGFPARHMDAKACINDYMAELGLPKTEVIFPFFFENFLTTFRPVLIGHNTYQMAVPVGETAMDAISVKQVGPIVVSLLKNSQRWIGKSCCLSAGKLRIDEYATILTQHLRPKYFKDARISVRTFVETNGEPGAQDMGNMFEFWKKGSQKMNAALTLELYPGIKQFSQWVSANKEQIQSVLDS
ncbi:nmrA-like family domain-containing protein 1 [Protopterus annectens]|uniref:nmrA-like family domain-containing protein 1 n=1 Tax=Protopterus annectens TaxID=7888 RepID=UPI001CF940C7|nr:nmrA-like family domain-containing protein 1 [Protopterus annectens]XP_043941224.1 nmrA-like family domain-containing protein 1 [Protopterus annectens]XP_043941225.1 nmrA-like family domain-containing protein 1 [Protopterus annectens]XP_043941226.1 nmrA-like family domain-containing protein 1 [Protopterus annectens]